MGRLVNSRDCTGAEAREWLRRNWETAKADRARPRFHFCPMSGWMNDPNGGIFVDGEYHFFYLQDPFDACGISAAELPDGTVVEGAEKPNRFWAHARTGDFIHWDYLPETLVPDRDRGEIKPISGSVLERKDGSYLMAFTSVREDGSYCQWGAEADKGLERWTRLDKPLADPPDAFEISGDWRDPYLFLWDETGYMVVGAVSGGEALLLLYEAEDESLLHWQYKGIFLSRPVEQVAFFECPKVLKMGDKMVLLFSPYKQMEYYAGEFEPLEGRFLVQQTGKIDYGVVAYASVDVEDEWENTYLLSWAPGWFNRKGISFSAWNGCVATPRKVWLDSKGCLRQVPCESMELLRGKTLFQWEEQQSVALGSIEVSGLPLQFEFSIKIKEKPKEGWHLSFSDSSTGEVLQILSCQGESVLIDGEDIFMQDGVMELHGFVDGFLWEYFIGSGEAVMTSGISRVPETVDMKLEGGQELYRIMNVTIWKIMDAKFCDCML